MFDALTYCAWLSSMTGSYYRLPTEAEWERASRGGQEGMLFPWGNDPPTSRPGYDARWKTGPEPVGQSQPNAYGLFDFCENVHEWCSDWYGADYYAISPDRNPQGRQKERENLRAEVPGGTKSRFHDAQHVQASRRNSSTLIMAFAPFATGLVEI
jgi:formylglycine-generating enzyme required for sulfatase activity